VSLAGSLGNGAECARGSGQKSLNLLLGIVSTIANRGNHRARVSRSNPGVPMTRLQFSSSLASVSVSTPPGHRPCARGPLCSATPPSPRDSGLRHSTLTLKPKPNGGRKHENMSWPRRRLCWRTLPKQPAAWRKRTRHQLAPTVPVQQVIDCTVAGREMLNIRDHKAAYEKAISRPRDAGIRSVRYLVST
jgi:hypothetical protein